MIVTILFPSEPFNVRRIDSAFVEESEAAAAAGFEVQLVDHSALQNGKLDQATRGVRSGTGAAIYRGWMMTPEQYKALFHNLKQKRIHLVNDPTGYRTCHCLPFCFGYIQSFTPKSIWVAIEDGGVDLSLVVEAAAQFNGAPLIVKDFVKSQKHSWEEACFIPDSSNAKLVESVVKRFIELQGPDLFGGIVLREFESFKTIGEHPKSGMPLSEEYRVFWYNRNPIATFPFWEGQTATARVPVELFNRAAFYIPSSFFSMDLAVTEDGRWRIVELGDGQVSGLQKGQYNEFFRALAQTLRQGC